VLYFIYSSNMRRNADTIWVALVFVMNDLEFVIKRSI